MTKERIFLTKLEIQIFCNVYYDGEGIGATVIRKMGNGRSEVVLDEEINVKGNIYNKILINDRVKNMSDKEINFILEMQKSYFNSKNKLN